MPWISEIVRLHFALLSFARLAKEENPQSIAAIVQCRLAETNFQLVVRSFAQARLESRHFPPCDLLYMEPKIPLRDGTRVYLNRVVGLIERHLKGR